MRAFVLKALACAHNFIRSWYPQSPKFRHSNVVTYISWSEKQFALNFYSRIVMDSKEIICLECFTFILMDFTRYQLTTISWQKKSGTWEIQVLLSCGGENFLWTFKWQLRSYMQTCTDSCLAGLMHYFFIDLDSFFI